MNIPTRTCIACRKRGNKTDFIRVVKLSNNEIVVDKNNKIFGRSSYICESKECIEKVYKHKLINKCFKQSIDQQIYEQIKLLINKEN